MPRPRWSASIAMRAGVFIGSASLPVEDPGPEGGNPAATRSADNLAGIARRRCDISEGLCSEGERKACCRALPSRAVVQGESPEGRQRTSALCHQDIIHGASHRLHASAPIFPVRMPLITPHLPPVLVQDVRGEEKLTCHERLDTVDGGRAGDIKHANRPL